MNALSVCSNDSWYCIPPRNTTAIISILCLISCFLDSLTAYDCHTKSKESMASFKHLLGILFQTASILLLLASIVENSTLVELYVLYTMAFVVMGLAVALWEFLLMFHEGTSSFWAFVTEVAFLFVIFRCLPLVDTYKKHLNDHTASSSIIT